jgi:TldD protein
MVDADLLCKVLRAALARGGEYADIFVEVRENTTIHLDDGKIEKVVIGSHAGLGVRLISEGRTAYAYSNDFSEHALTEIGRSVCMAASGSTRDVVIDMRRRYPGVTFAIQRLPETVPLSQKVALVRRGDAAARGTGAGIRQVSATYRDSRQRVTILRSDGVFAEDDRVFTSGMVHVVAGDAQAMQTGYEAIGGHVGFEIFDETPFDRVGSAAAARALLMLRARRAPGGRMSVVISSEAGGTMIHEAIGHGLEADLARQGLSVYSGKLGEQVASSVVSVIDDATLPGKRGSFAFDDEGTPSRRNVLVERGVLMGYLYDIHTSMADGAAPTGNGRRESYEHRPIPRMTNTFIAPGEASPDDVVRSVAQGLFVKKMGGGQVNTVTGDFVFEVQEGYLIENGALGEPVRGATLIGSGPEVLQSIDMVGSDLGFSIGTCGKDSQGVPVSDAMPTLKIPEIVVGGEVR